MTDRIDKTIIRIETDQQAARRVIAQVGQVQAEMRQMAANIKDVGVAGGRAEAQLARYGKSAQDAGRRIDTLNSEMDALRRETLEASEAQERLERSLRNVGRAASEQDFTAQYRAARQENRLEAFTGSALTDILQPVGLASAMPVQIAGDMFRFVDAIPDAKLGLTQLTKQMGLADVGAVKLGAGIGVAALATTALVIGIDALSNASEKARERVEAAIEAERRRAQIAPEFSTRDELTEALKQLDLDMAKRAEQIRRAEEDRQALFDSYNAFEQLAEATGIYNQGLDEQDAYLKELRVSQAADAQLKESLEQALREGATATADAADAEERLAARRVAAAQTAMSAIDQQMQREIAQRRQIASYTPAQVDSEVSGLRDQIAAYDNALVALRAEFDAGVINMVEFREKEKALADARDRAAEDLTYLDTTVRAAAQRRASAADSEKRLEQATKDAERAVNDIATAEQRRAGLLASYADATEQTATRRGVDDAREAEDFARKQAADRAKHNADLIALDRKHLEDRAALLAKLGEGETEAEKARLDALRDFQDREKKATVDYWRDMRKINRDERLSVLDAAARLDASAVLAAQRQAEQQRQERTEQYEAERAERQADYDDRLAELAEQRREKQAALAQELRDLEDKHRRERAERIRAFNQQQADEASDRALRQQRLAQDRAYEDSQRQKQFNAELAAINNLITAAEDLERKSRAAIQAANTRGGAGGGGPESDTQRYYRELAQTAAQGRYVTWAGQRVRVDRYDPQQAAGMTAGDWYNWKLRYGYQYGGTPPVGRDVLVGERGAEWVRFMTPVRVFPHGVTPPGSSVNNSRSMGDVHITINESGNPRRTAEIVRAELMEILR